MIRLLALEMKEEKQMGIDTILSEFCFSLDDETGKRIYMRFHMSIYAFEWWMSTGKEDKLVEFLETKVRNAFSAYARRKKVELDVTDELMDDVKLKIRKNAEAKQSAG